MNHKANTPEQLMEWIAAGAKPKGEPPLAPAHGSANRAEELLDVIVKPGDHEIQWAIEEAQRLLGYEVNRLTKQRSRRSYYGIRSPNEKGQATPPKI